ncbi:MAG: 4Fe-4S binding protein [Gammaproteobacteria bacterium]
MSPRDPLTIPRLAMNVRNPRIVRAAARVTAVCRLNHDMRQVTLRLDDHEPMFFARGGQFVVLDVPSLGISRPFSLARAPAAEKAREVTLLVRVVAEGAFSTWLESDASVGSKVVVAGAMGGFVLDEGDNYIICVAGGSGLSAVRALLEEAALAQVARHACLFYGARTQADLVLQDEIEALCRSWHPDYRCEFVPVLSEEPTNTDWSGARGWVADAARAALAASKSFVPQCASVFLCGPPPMIEAAEAQFKALQVPDAAIRRDVFEDARSPAPVIDNRLCVLCDECLLVKPIADCIVEATPHLGGDAVREPTPIQPAFTSGLYYNALVIDEQRCIRCYACVNACPHGAIAPDYDKDPQILRRR